MVQPTQAVQGENSLHPDTYKLPAKPLTPGGGPSSTHTPLWPRNQEGCRSHTEQTAQEHSNERTALASP